MENSFPLLQIEKNGEGLRRIKLNAEVLEFVFGHLSTDLGEGVKLQESPRQADPLLLVFLERSVGKLQFGIFRLGGRNVDDVNLLLELLPVDANVFFDQFILKQDVLFVEPSLEIKEVLGKRKLPNGKSRLLLVVPNVEVERTQLFLEEERESGLLGEGKEVSLHQENWSGVEITKQGELLLRLGGVFNDQVEKLAQPILLSELNYTFDGEREVVRAEQEKGLLEILRQVDVGFDIVTRGIEGKN